MKDLGDSAGTHGRAFNRAFDLRMTADYGVGSRVLAETAREVAEEARRFVPFCEALARE